MPKRDGERERPGKRGSSATKKPAAPMRRSGARSPSTSARASSGSSAKKSSAATRTRPTPRLGADFVDLLSALSKERARFLVIGGYAVGVHGHPRATRGLDIWIEPTRANARRVLDALRVFGAPVSALGVADLTHPDGVFQIGISPNRVDILSTIPGVEFAACWRRRLPVSFGGVEAPVISRTDLNLEQTRVRPASRSRRCRSAGGALSTPAPCAA